MKNEILNYKKANQERLKAADEVDTYMKRISGILYDFKTLEDNIINNTKYEDVSFNNMDKFYDTIERFAYVLNKLQRKINELERLYHTVYKISNDE